VVAPTARLDYMMFESARECLTDPWIEVPFAIGKRHGLPMNEDDMRLRVVRELLIDVPASDDAAKATRKSEQFLEMWSTGSDE
jgi:hypothetical protein